MEGAGKAQRKGQHRFHGKNTFCSTSIFQDFPFLVSSLTVIGSGFVNILSDLESLQRSSTILSLSVLLSSAGLHPNRSCVLKERDVTSWSALSIPVLFWCSSFFWKGVGLGLVACYLSGAFVFCSYNSWGLATEGESGPGNTDSSFKNSCLPNPVLR